MIVVRDFAHLHWSALGDPPYINIVIQDFHVNVIIRLYT